MSTSYNSSMIGCLHSHPTIFTLLLCDPHCCTVPPHQHHAVQAPCGLAPPSLPTSHFANTYCNENFQYLKAGCKHDTVKALRVRTIQPQPARVPVWSRSLDHTWTAPVAQQLPTEAEGGPLRRVAFAPSRGVGRNNFPLCSRRNFTPTSCVH